MKLPLMPGNFGRRLSILTLLLTVAGGAATAGTISFSGNFNQDDDVWLMVVPLAAPSEVVLSTSSFAAGGFAPVLSVFDQSGLLLATDNDGGVGGCGPRPVDPATGFCWDAYLDLNLSAGNYLLALSEDDNKPYGPTYSDGFSRAGQGDFTGPAFLGQPGSFVLVTGAQRTSDFAVQVQTVPEPGTEILMLGGLVGLLGLVRRTGGRASTRSLRSCINLQ